MHGVSRALTDGIGVVDSGKISDTLGYLLTGKKSLVKGMFKPDESNPSANDLKVKGSLSSLPRMLFDTTECIHTAPVSSHVPQNERILFSRKIALLENMILQSSRRESMMEQRVLEATNYVSIAERKAEQLQEQAKTNREHLRVVEIANRELGRINRKLEDKVLAIMDERHRATEQIDLGHRMSSRPQKNQSHPSWNGLP